MAVEFEPPQMQKRYEPLNHLLYRAAIEMEPLKLPLVRVKIIRQGYLGIFPGMTLGWHEHPYYEFITMIEGCANHYIDEHIISCDAVNHTISITPPLTLHRRTYNDECGVIRTLILSFEAAGENGKMLCRLLPELLREREYQFQPSRNLLEFFEKLDSEEMVRRDSISLVDCYTKLAVAELLFQLVPEIFLSELPEQFRRQQDFNRNRIEAIKAFVYHGINVRGCLPLSQEFGMSERHLNRIFKQETGISICRYRINCKIEVAQNLLRTSDNSIQEIAHAMRFKSLSQFSTFFSKYCGCSPQEYRLRNHREAEETEQL